MLRRVLIVLMIACLLAGASGLVVCLDTQRPVLREAVIEAFTPESMPRVVMGPGGFIAFELNPEDVCRVLLLRGQNDQ